AVAQTGNAASIEQVRVDARHLRRGVGAQAHHAPGQLIHQLEGLQAQRLASAGEQRLQVLEQRRHDQLVAIAARRVEQTPAQFFDVSGLGRQNIGDVIRQNPGGHEYSGELMKRRFYRAGGPTRPQDSSHSHSSPVRMLHRPKKRSCPSCNCRICTNTRRHLAGDTSGNRPSMTSTRASAVQNVLLSTVGASGAYFFAGRTDAAAAAGAPPSCMILKKSEDSSITIASLFLSKLALYASRLR